jgi:hypothetical protein
MFYFIYTCVECGVRGAGNACDGEYFLKTFRDAKFDRQLLTLYKLQQNFISIKTHSAISINILYTLV